MKVCVLLLCVCLCCRTQADPRTFLITAPLALRLDAVETVLLQLFGFTDEVTVYVFLKTSMAADRDLVREVVTLNAQNNYQAAARVQLRPGQLDKSASHVTLLVQSQHSINEHVEIPVSRTNGFLFVQTDKPLYTPHQSVKVRAISLNQELRPANRSVFLRFKDPDQTTVDIVEMNDANNGIPSMVNPFKIPIKPKLGIWTIEATYSNDFTTKETTDFEVREYVLPSFNIQVAPQANYISYGSFERFNLKLTARYLHGAPVALGEVYLRYGYVSGNSPPVIIPSSITKERLSSRGELDITLNMKRVLSRHNGPKDLNGVVGRYLYVAVLLQEATGGISQEAEFAAVKFVRSPYRLSLVSTSPYIKPGLPYHIQVLVKDHLDKPVRRVPVRLVRRLLFKKGTDSEPYSCDTESVSQSNGVAYFICNTPRDAVRAELEFKTADSALPADSQASLSQKVSSYHSPNARYLYIDPPQLDLSLQVGQYANLKVYSMVPSFVPVRALSYVVISKGKIVHFGSQTFLKTGDNKQTVSFEVTGAMAPSIRLLVYYIVHAEGTSELVADSVWLDVKAKCVNGLQTDMSARGQTHKPKEQLHLDVRTNQEGHVALNAVDSALYTLRPNYKDPVSTVLRHLEKSDLGCGGGGGSDNADVFRLAGLTFMTNANAQRSSSSEPCHAIVRPRRALTEAQKTEQAEKYGNQSDCCRQGMKFVPKSITCEQYAAQTHRKRPRCRKAFKECCEFYLQHLDTLDQGRHALGADFDQAPTLVRSYFPESWMWEVQPVSPGQLSLSRALPDSLTTWEINAVGVFPNGVCAADPLQVSVSLPLSVDVPLPYQVVRGEQVELSGSVYNQQRSSISYCVTLTAGPAVCLQQSVQEPGEAGLHSTACSMSPLPGGGVGDVKFTLLGLEAGEHVLTFTLRTDSGDKDILQKKLRVVPEGVRKEEFSGGRLDPQGLYGSEKRTVELKNRVPSNVVPNAPVQRQLTINGEILGDFLSVVQSPEGLRQLINLPAGSAEAELGGLLPLALVYQYLETTRSWDVLGADIMRNAADLRQKIREGLVSVSSFRRGDSSYSMWRNREPSTWLTALVVKTLSLVDPVVPVDHQSLSDSVSWLIRVSQQRDGSFRDTSSFRPNKVLAEGAPPLDRAVYLTSFVLVALHRASGIRDPLLQLKSHSDSMAAAADYISQHAPAVKSVYVSAVAAYALNLHDPNRGAASDLISRLEKLSHSKGHPVELRYWQESSVKADWVKPDETSGLTVETTAYVLLTMLLKGRIPYANPILSWLTQDQHYGEGFYTVQDTVLTLEAITEYSRIVPRAVLNQDINVRFDRKGTPTRVQLSQSRPVATPMQVTTNNDVTVSTGYGRGVSNVKLKTVYYQTAAAAQNCTFDITVEVAGPATSTNPTMNAPHLVACARFLPPPGEPITESSLTVMKVQLPTGVEAMLEDLRQFTDADEPTVSHYEQDGNTVIIQMDSVPSDVSLCVGFRVRTGFRVGGATESLLTVYEQQDRGHECTKSFTYQQQRLQRLCVDEMCQCMTAACATYRGDVDVTLTSAKRTAETCKPLIKYALQVSVKSSVSEGDFVTYRATVGGVLKKDKDFDAVSSGTEVELVQKVTCTNVDIQNNKQYLVMGASGSEVTPVQAIKYRLPLDSEALVELWPTECSSPNCKDYISQLESYNEEMLLFGCI